MSVMVLICQNYIRWFKSTVKLIPSVGRVARTNRWYSNDGSISNSYFGHSVILLQDGLNIEELPIAVRRANHRFLQLQSNGQFKKKTINEEERTDTIFKNCKSPETMISLLDKINKNDISAVISYQALAKMAELTVNKEYLGHGVEIDKSFTIDAVLLQLGNTICKTGTTDLLISSLRLAILPSFPGRTGELRKLFAESCLNHVIDNNCHVHQVCQIIELFSAMSQEYWSDKCWVGIIGRPIEEKDVLRVFEILQFLRESRRAVFNYLEKVLVSNDKQLDCDSVIRILSIVEELKLPHKRICLFLSKWTRLNLHTITDDKMTSFLVMFQRLDHFDQHFNRVIETFFKSRTSELQQDLIVAAADYCCHFRFYSTSVLNTIANGFAQLGEERLNVQTVEVVLSTFGLFNFHPDNDFEFWSTAESVIERRFAEFQPEALLNALMSCIYLHRYPMNFIPRIFSPHFIYLINNQTLKSVVDSCRYKMKLLDAAMSFECNQYGSSLVLPKDYYAKAISRDGRVARISGQLVTPLQEVCGIQFTVTTSVVLRDLPLSPIYTVDLLISPANQPVHFRYGYNRKHDNRNCLAILIHPPEHYTVGTTAVKRLTGLQAMRHHHFCLMDFRPIHLDLEEITSLLLKPKHLRSFLKSHIVPLPNDCS